MSLGRPPADGLPPDRGLEWSTDRIGALLDAAPDGVLIIDHHDVIVHVNPIGLEHLGATRDAIVGLTIEEFLTGFTGTSVPERYQALRAEGGKAEFEDYVPALDGWYRFFADADALGDGLMLVFVREVTGHRLADRRTRLIEQVIAAVEPMSTMGETLRAALAVIRRELQFEVAELWSTTESRRHLLAVDHDDHRSDHDLAVADWVVAQGDGPSTAESELPEWDQLDAVVEAMIPVGTDRPLMLRMLRTRALSDDDSALVLRASVDQIAATLAQRRARIEVDQFFELTREYVVIMSEDGRLRRVNPVVVERLGFGDATELIDVPFEQLVHPDDIAVTRANLQLTVATGEPVEQFVQRVRTADGSYRWISWNAQGSVEERIVFTTGRDVTVERADRLARQELDAVLRGVVAGEGLRRTLERLVEVAAGAGSVAGCVLALLGDATDQRPWQVIDVVAAPSMAESLVDAVGGSGLEAAIGDLTSVIGERESVTVHRIGLDPRWAPQRDVLMANGVDALVIMPIRGADDRVLGLLVIAAPSSEALDGMRWDRVHEVLGLAGLAVESAHSVEALAANEERFRIVAEVITDAVFERSVDGRWTTDAFETVFGHRVPPTGVDDAWWLDRVHPDDRPEVTRALTDAIELGDDRWEVEYRFARADGRTADVRVRARLVRDRGGRVVNLIGGMADVTERRELEREYLRALRIESLGTLAGGIAHDLNNSLSPILMGAELMSEHALDPEAHDLLEMILVAAHRSAGMVRNILTYARGIDGPRRVVDLDDVIATAIKLIGDTFPKRIEIVRPAAPTGLVVRGDPTQIHQVLMNLAVNARDAMPTGGVLTIDVDAVDDGRSIDLDDHVASPPEDGGPFARIRVSDTGSGMSAAVRDRVFEPFFTTKARSEGTGLGLPTALSIARAHGGGLVVSSRPGRGTTIELYLPLVDRATVGELDHSGPIPRSDLGPEPGLSVLVVDDEAAVRAMLRQMLESLGHDVVEAADGGEAAMVMREREIDLLLTDVMMPGIDGVELVTSLRSAGIDLPIVAMTGLTDDRRTLQFPEGSISGMLAKPFDRAALVAAMSAALPH